MSDKTTTAYWHGGAPGLKPCAKCHHPKSRHRTRECRTTWQTRGQTFMGVSTITKWCTCDGYEPIEEKS